MIQMEEATKLLRDYSALNKGRPAIRPKGFSDPEVAGLVAYLAEHEADIFVADSKVKSSLPAWVAIDQTAHTVSGGAKKSDLLTAWSVQYGVDTAKRTQQGFYPEGFTKANAEPGMRAYSYTYKTGLRTVHELLLIPGPFLAEHMGEDADRIKAALASGETTERETARDAA